MRDKERLNDLFNNSFKRSVENNKRNNNQRRAESNSFIDNHFNNTLSRFPLLDNIFYPFSRINEYNQINNPQNSPLHRQFDNKTLQIDKKKKIQKKKVKEKVKGIEPIIESIECPICCDELKDTDQVWSCINCKVILHNKCSKATVKAKKKPFNCPYCTISDKRMYRNTCYCGKKQCPPKNKTGRIYNCGKVCGKLIKKDDSICKFICHPGKCEDQKRTIVQPTIVLDNSFGTDNLIKLKTYGKCGKQLDCQKHYCTAQEHESSVMCINCNKAKEIKCYCGNSKIRTCNTSVSCNKVCNKTLNCQIHKCTKECHKDSCELCEVVNIAKCGHCKENYSYYCGQNKINTSL